GECDISELPAGVFVKLGLVDVVDKKDKVLKTIGRGEEYITSAYRELYEEVGIKTPLVFLGKHYIKLDDGHKHFIAFFKGMYNGKIKINLHEVSKVIFFSIKEIKKMIDARKKIHPECLFALKNVFYRDNSQIKK
ncbi:MAG: NUDIX domain-containing protein, partial [Nanoarchaeota archaeon]